MNSNSSYFGERSIYYLYIIFDSLIFLFVCKNFLTLNYSLSIKSITISSFCYVIWTINNYIFGSYISKKSKIFNIFFKLFFNYSFSLVIYLPIILISMFNFPTINKLPLFISIVKINYLSFFIHLILAFIFTRNNKKTKWLFLGDKDLLIKLKKECKKCKYETVISTYRGKSEKATGIIIDDNFNNIKNISKLKIERTILLSNWLGLYLNKYPIDLIPNLFLVSDVFDFKNSSLQLRIKNVSERLIALFLLIITFPIIALSGILILIDDGLPIFYSQNRNGTLNKIFKITKLRTMKSDAEKNGAEWSKKNDHRITRVGNLIRRIRIDELPQLISVIKGEMALIGPRPERPEIDSLLSKKIKNYNIRYIAKPGLSGWAQVNYPYGASIQDAKEKFSYDIYYIRNFSNLLDLLILIKTIKMVFNAKGSIPKS